MYILKLCIYVERYIFKASSDIATNNCGEIEESILAFSSHSNFPNFHPPCLRHLQPTDTDVEDNCLSLLSEDMYDQFHTCRINICYIINLSTQNFTSHIIFQIINKNEIH